MTISYHELTHASGSPPPRNTPAERKQMLTICVIGFSVLIHAFIKAGVLEPVNIKDNGIYPGGQFVYKYIEKRDYAASAGLLRTIDDDLKATQPADKTTSYDDILYSVFIDNADADVNMGDGRFFGGILIDKSQSSLKDGLFELNGVDASKMDNSDMKMTPYEVGDLPSVRAALAVFPYTGGFVSALLHNYKVYPALLKYALENHKKGQKFIISSSCNIEKQYCHHYVPMTKVNSFMMGKPSSEEYKKDKLDGISYGIDFGSVFKLFRKSVWGKD